ncbi:U4/U6 x U5 tri-snRNP complex subunit Prp1 [Massospora cicadina]|nr:U4/U6 x U5 tri-snRNP complex subunit Prp1 [Massospora cicadina]
MFHGVKDFMGRTGPAGYVGGLGRGATGFTTRSDIGPAREDAPVAAFSGVGIKPEDDEQYQDPDNETGLFSSMPYEQDDEDADRVYAEVDKKMDERRRSRREAHEKEQLLKFRKERPKIQQQFADLKRGLEQMTRDDWESIPEVGDIVGKNRKKVNPKERFTPVPDSILEKIRDNATYAKSIDPIQQKLGYATPGPESGMLTNFVEIGAARDKVLNLKLDQVSSDAASGKATVDPRGYLTDLNSLTLKTDAEIGDIKKARLLLKSVTTTNPSHGPGWIAAARLEEVAGKLAQARHIITKGTEECPKNEDVWLEAARLNTPDNAKLILASAVRQLPRSVKIWMRAAALEEDPAAKKRVFRRALEFIPTSLVIWQAAIRLEDNPSDAKVLLAMAVKLIPSSIELWLALARLETFENAKKVLQKARQAIPTSHEIWIAAAQLVAAQEPEKVDQLIQRAVVLLARNGVHLTREQWQAEAERCELELNSVEVGRSIIRATLGLNVEKDEEREVWLEAAEASAERGAIEISRTIYEQTLKAYPEKKGVWLQAAYFEKEHGTHETLDALLARSVKYCPQAEVLWLMRAKEKWLLGELQDAQAILEQAFKANPKSEQIYLAAAKLEVENKEFDRARSFFLKARANADTEKVWMKSIVLERLLGNLDQAKSQLDEANRRFPSFDKLWMLRGQVEEDRGDVEAARDAYAQGLRHCSQSVPLWVLGAQVEERAGLLIKARAILERARKLNPKVDLLWLAAIRFEGRNNNAAIAKVLLAKALQECPSSGGLWADAIMMETRQQRKSRVADAIKNCDNDPIIFTTMARIFWNDRKIDTARNWFARATKHDSDYGDAWAWWYKFELAVGTPEQLQSVVSACAAADPKHGEVWQRVSKTPANYFVRGRSF